MRDDHTGRDAVAVPAAGPDPIHLDHHVPVGHARRPGPARGHDRGPGHGKHAGHDPQMFRRRFWLCLALTLPIVVSSEMVMDWFGYSLALPGRQWIGPVLGSVVFFYGGWPFVVGGVREVRDRAPGMMLLISMAITVAYAASLATSVGWFALDFWWELAALVTIMLLGHWQEMKAIGQAQGALAALAALLPDEAERITGDAVEPVAVTDLRVGDVVLVRSGARVPADGRIVDGSAELDESMITGESHPHHLELVAVRVGAVDAFRGAVTGLAGEGAGIDEVLTGLRELVDGVDLPGEVYRPTAPRRFGAACGPTPNSPRS
jgi:P-type Cu2+ transporter